MGKSMKSELLGALIQPTHLRQASANYINDRHLREEARRYPATDRNRLIRRGAERSPNCEIMLLSG